MTYDHWKAEDPRDVAPADTPLCRTCSSQDVSDQTYPWCFDCHRDGRGEEDPEEAPL